MHSKILTIASTALSLPSIVMADGAFHYAAYYVSYFRSFNGTLIVPPGVPSGGTPYVWPGLQPGGNGVLQNVLDGRNQHWYFGNTWVGSPSEPYGGGVDASVNEAMGFSMVENPTGSGNWDITSSNSGGSSATYHFAVGQRMDQALFCVELYDNSWDFGNVVFENVVIVGEGSDSSWCTAQPQYSDVTVSFEGVSSTSGDNVVNCYVSKVTLSPP